MNDGSKILAAFLAGAAVGAALALLYAPATGAETRQNLSEGARKLGDRIRSKAEAGINYANSMKDKASGKIGDMLRSNEQAGTV